MCTRSRTALRPEPDVLRLPGAIQAARDGLHHRLRQTSRIGADGTQVGVEMRLRRAGFAPLPGIERHGLLDADRVAQLAIGEAARAALAPPAPARRRAGSRRGSRSSCGLSACCCRTRLLNHSSTAGPRSQAFSSGRRSCQSERRTSTCARARFRAATTAAARPAVAGLQFVAALQTAIRHFRAGEHAVARGDPHGAAIGCANAEQLLLQADAGSRP